MALNKFSIQFDWDAAPNNKFIEIKHKENAPGGQHIMVRAEDGDILPVWDAIVTMVVDHIKADLKAIYDELSS